MVKKVICVNATKYFTLEGQVSFLFRLYLVAFTQMTFLTIFQVSVDKPNANFWVVNIQMIDEFIGNSMAFNHF